MKSPSPNGHNGRDAHGRFRKGNAGGPGNPLGGKVAKLRSALVEAVTQKDMKAIVAALVKQAKAGDTAAAKLVLSYTIGQPLPADVLERLQRLEQTAEMEHQR